MNRMTRRQSAHASKLALNAAFYGAVGALAVAAFQPRFSPKEHVGFPALSMGDQYLASLQTGDIIFFNYPSYIHAKPVKWLYNQMLKSANHNADFEHMGVIVVHPEEKYPYVLEKGVFGTSIATPFEDRIAYTSAQDVMLRTFHLMRDSSFQQKANEFLEQELNDAKNLTLAAPTPSGAFSRMGQFLHELSAVTGQIYRDFRQPVLRDTSVKQVADLASIQSLKYSTDVRDHAKLDDVLSSTDRKTGLQNTQVTELPKNRVTLYSNMVDSLRILRQAETRLSKHLAAEKAMETYEKDLQNYKLQTLQQSGANSLEKALNTATNSTTEPMMPSIGKDLLPKQDLLLLLKRRTMVYDEFHRQFNEYRDFTAEVSSYNFFYNPTLVHSPSAAFPGCDLVTRLYQHLQLLPKPRFEGIAPVDVQTAFPPGIPRLEDAQRGENDLREFSFAKAYDTISDWAPYSKEYKPQHWRTHHNLHLDQGLLGDEQMLMTGFTKPPLEYRTGRNIGILPEGTGPEKM